MTLVLVAIFAIERAHALERRELARRVPRIVEISTDLFSAIQTFRVERETVNTALATPEVAPPETQKAIEELRSRSAETLQMALGKLGTVPVPGIEPALERIQAELAVLSAKRPEVDAALLRAKAERPRELGPSWIVSVHNRVSAIDQLSIMLESELAQTDAFIADMTRIKQIVWSVRSDSGDDRLVVREAMVTGERLSDQQREDMARLAGRIDGTWKLVRDESRLPSTPPELKAAVDTADRLYFADFRPIRDRGVRDLPAGTGDLIPPPTCLELVTPRPYLPFTVSKTAFDLAGAHAFEQASIAERDLTVSLLLMALFLGVGIFTGAYVFRHIVRPIAHITRTMGLVANGDLSCDIPFQQRSDEI